MGRITLTSFEKFRRALVLLVALSTISSVSIPRAGTSESLHVLYLGNDYYQDEDGGWIDANPWIIDALNDSGPFIVRFMAPAGDGYKSRDLRFGDFDVVIFSEVWRSHFSDSQLSDLEGHVKGGGGFLMFGGWGGFGGRDEYGEWDDTVVEEMLPVKILSNEDAMDVDCALKPKEGHMDHPILSGLEWEEIPSLHGYNRVKSRGQVLAVNSETGDPMLVVGRHGKGRVVAFASDPAGGWGLDFVEWDSYDLFLRNMAAWSGKSAGPEPE